MSHNPIHSKYHHLTRRSINSLLVICFLLASLGASAQDKAELQKERDEISKNIELTNKLLKETRSSRNKEEGELSLINKKISLREDLISSLRSEVALYSRRIKDNEAEVEELESRIETLKEKYAKAIQFAQRTQQTEDKLMFIFASQDLYQAIRRIRALKQYTKYRQDQVAQIKEAQSELKALNENMQALISEKNEVMGEEEKVKEVLSADLEVRQTAVSSLKQEESKLSKKLKQQERQRNKLNKEIQRIIEEEIRASKKNNAGTFELTPEAAALSASFESNKGKLPWPVERGVITSKFGNNPHPVLAGITVPNNGIDIATSSNAIVRSVFKGTVSAVFSIPGAGQNVIINHGGYRSVYSNLQEVLVSKGQEIESKQSIGSVLTDENTGKTEAHLEIWKVDSKGTTKQNPATWLYKQ